MKTLKSCVKNLFCDHKKIARLMMVLTNKRIKGNFQSNAFFLNSNIDIEDGNCVVFSEQQLLRNIYIHVAGKNNHVMIGGGIEQIAPIEIVVSGNSNKIYIGAGSVFCSDKTRIAIYGDSCEISLENGHSLFKGATIKCHDVSSKINIMNGFSCAENTRIISAEGKMISIGKDFLCSYNVEIRNTDAHTILDNNIRINSGKDIIIGDHVWCAQDVLLLKGTEIGSGCIVGAKSLVNKKYSDNNAIIAGVPAKIVRRNIHWIKERYQYND